MLNFYSFLCDEDMIHKNLENENLVFCNNLKEIRTKQNLTQQELADLIGVSRNTIGSIERSVFIPTAKLALILCIALNVKFEEMFYFEKKEEDINEK